MAYLLYLRRDAQSQAVNIAYQNKHFHDKENRVSKKDISLSEKVAGV